jgi:hypothetical protein
MGDANSRPRTGILGPYKFESTWETSFAFYPEWLFPAAWYARYSSKTRPTDKQLMVWGQDANRQFEAVEAEHQARFAAMAEHERIQAVLAGGPQ